MLLQTFIVLALASLASATGLAGAYERIILWHAYRICVSTYGKDQQFIMSDYTRNGVLVKGCQTGTSKLGGCTFNEFIERVNGEGAVNLSDDVEHFDTDDMAKKINADKAQTRFFQTRRVIGESRDFPGFIEEVVNRAMAARAELDGKTGGSKKLLRNFEAMEKALNVVIELRNSDQQSHIKDDLKKKFDKAVPVTKTVDVKGQKYDILDVEETFKQSPKKTFSLQQLRIFVNSYGKNAATGPPSGTSQDHEDVLKAWRLQKGKLQSGVKKCNKGKRDEESLEALFDIENLHEGTTLATEGFISSLSSGTLIVV
ncbi:hypothetical protein B0H67DRAFT_593036 [Lasiosphaeris hirsuta]|uniref:Uncharacterized protein n=1 Tax=Lasiosphaeris hirsuta TaxID=260670 RepID=A0AA40DJ35_9PEZI|nr:hypothetical protein B0H67DRAFT_593036 [Lasiosphaeris hirsuta]